MANMTFKANLLPNTDLGYSLGSSNLRWKLFGKFQNINLDNSTLNSEEGSFTYVGAGTPFEGCDWVGLQVGDTTEKWQIMGDQGSQGGTGPHLAFRFNDNGGNNSAGWSNWTTYVNRAGDTMSGNLKIEYNNRGINYTNTDIYAIGANYSGNAISFLDSNDSYGMGVRIGLGGSVVVGGGESSVNLISAKSLNTGGTESLYLTADADIYVESNCDTIANRSGIKIYSKSILPVAAEANSTNNISLGASGVRFSKCYLGTADSYGGTAQPIYWNAGVPAALSATVGSGVKPVFLSSGTIMASSSTVGGGEQPIYLNAGTLQNTTYALKATVNNGTASRLVYYSTARALSEAAGLSYIRQNNSKSASQTILHIQGQTYGNDAAYMLSGTAGLFSWGDGGPQITFDTSATPGGGQAGALIFTDHDTAAAGASFHFVSNQGDWNVTSKRFHARTNISIGSNLPVTSHNLFVTGTSKFTSHVYNAGHVYFANGTTYYINNAGTFNLNGGSIVQGSLWIRNNGTLEIDHRTTTKAKNTMYTAGGLRFKNAANSVDYYSAWLRYVGTDGTDGYNTCLVYGSQNGTTWLGAGESSSTMPTVLSKYNDENLYLSTDGAINFYTGCANDASSYKLTLECRANGYAYATRLYGAVWNDYAEMRQSNIIEPGRCVKETGDGNLILSTKRLERGCNIISDTYGFAIGETEKCKTPIAVSGRVLAYCYEGQEEARKWIGYGVCSGPNGTVSIMTEEEERLYPNMIIGIISEIPNYDTWQAGSETNSKNIIIDGRIWIKVK